MSLLSFGSSSPGGFHNAPFTKIIILISCTFTAIHILLYSILSRPFLTYPLNLYATLYNQPYMIYRLFTGIWTYYTMGDFFFSTLILYLVGRQIERMWGSLKMVVFFTVILLVGFPCQLALAVVTPLWSGLYPLVFALMVQYWRDVPALIRIKLFGKVSINEKWALYTMAFQLFFGNFWHSSCVAALGILLGLFWRLPFMKRLHRLVPQPIVDFFRKHVYPVLNPSPMRQRRRRNTRRSAAVPASTNNNDQQADNAALPQQQVRNLMAEDQQQAAGANALFQQLLQNYAQASQQRAAAAGASPPTNAAPEPQPQQVNEDLLTSMVEMGFDRDRSRDALLQSNNDVNAAISILSS